MDMKNRARRSVITLAVAGALVAAPQAAMSAPSIAETILLPSGADGPRGMAIDSLGNIYTTNLISSNVTKITPAGVATNLSIAGGIQPYGIAIDSARNVYTANYGSDNVTKITAGGVATILNVTGTAPRSPRGIAVDAAGNNVYTANQLNNTVTKITTANGDASTLATNVFGSQSPYYLAVAASGDIYTTNQLASSVTKLLANGTAAGSPWPVSTVVVPGPNPPARGLSPSGITIDSSGNLYTANTGDLSVTKITTPGGTATRFGGDTGYSPYGIAIDSDGNVYTANNNSSGTVSKISADGATTTLVYGATGNNPQGIAVDAAGNVYTANFGSDSVTKLIPAWNLAVTRPGEGSGSVSSSPAGIDCGSTCDFDFAKGTSLTLTASADPGSVFTGWSGACSGTSATCTVTMSQARSVTAEFAIAQTLSVTKAGVGSGTVTSSPAGIDCGSTCTSDFADGAVVALTASAASGSEFTGWGGACSGTSTTCTVTMSQAEAATATFASVPTPSPGPTPATNTGSSPSPTPVTPWSPPSLDVQLLPSRRSLRAGQAMTLGVRTSNGVSTSAAMARMRGLMSVATAQGVRTCVGLPANLVLTRRPSGSVRSGRTVCWSSGDIPAGQQRTAVLGVRAVAVQAVSRTISASARSTAGSQASATATAKAGVRITPRAPRPVVTG